MTSMLSKAASTSSSVSLTTTENTSGTSMSCSSLTATPDSHSMSSPAALHPSTVNSSSVSKPTEGQSGLEDADGTHIGTGTTASSSDNEISRKELELLPQTPPTVPLKTLFCRYQSEEAFTLFTSVKVSDLYKCMVHGCTFSCMDSLTFVSHLDHHTGEELRCSYCLIKSSAPNVLVHHIIEEHGHCQYQCKYCLYRAYQSNYLESHMKSFHRGLKALYHKFASNLKPPAIPSTKRFVHPYKCTCENCSFRTIDKDIFRGHVRTHGADVKLSCSFCDAVHFVDDLIIHMCDHMMNDYQCPFCLFGESKRERLISHLIFCHPGREGKVLVRKQANSSANTNTTTSTSVTGVTPLAAARPVASTTLASGVATSLPSVSGPASLMVASTPYTSNVTGQVVSTSFVSGETSQASLPTSVCGPELASLHASQQLHLMAQKHWPVLHSLSSSSYAESSVSQSTASPTYASKTGLIDGDFSNQALLGNQPESTSVKTDLHGTALYRCGNEKCEYSCPTQLLLKEHLHVCDLSRDCPVLRCYHCAKQCRHISTLLDHLRVHGPKRYICGVDGCDYRATMVHYFKNHMKQVHHVNNFKQVEKDFTNRDPETQEFLIYPKDAAPSVKEPHRKRKNEYGVEDIDKIPLSHISYQEMQCYHCTFCSKVRVNMIRHLKLHEKFPYVANSESSSESIPSKQPLNPVPCLERKELMFDKMMNLAGSSFESKKRLNENDLRLKHPIPEEELAALPQQISEKKLNSCGVQGCKYLSCDESTLLYHIQMLHSDITSFLCPHCQNLLTVETVSDHLRLHSDYLYRCGWCTYLSVRRGLVDRHLRERHADKQPFDFVIREPADAPATGNISSEGEEEERPVVQLPKKSGNEDCGKELTIISVMKTHASKGAEKCNSDKSDVQEPQWQCGLCVFKCRRNVDMVNHAATRHDVRSQYQCGYCNVRSSVRASIDDHYQSKHKGQPFKVLCMYYRLGSDEVEPLLPSGTHEPIWKRNNPERKKMIRGIIVEEDVSDEKQALLNIEPGNPSGEEYVCPKCISFKTPCVSTFRSHLCKEANYLRYRCAECGVANPLLPSIRRHYTKTHGKAFDASSYTVLPIEEELEAWVESIICHQQHLIKQWKQNSPQKGSLSSPVKSVKKQTSFQENPGTATPISTPSMLLQGPSHLVCQICGVECRSVAGLKSHTSAMHQSRFKCQYCPFSSNTDAGIKQHCSSSHPHLQAASVEVLPPGTGEDVGVGAQPGSQRSSTKLHPGETDKRIYKCNSCDYVTVNINAYYSHCRRHPETRPYLCNLCNNRFITLGDGLKHSRVKHPYSEPNIVHSPFTEQLNTSTSSSMTAEDNTSKSADSKLRSKDAPDGIPGAAAYCCCHCGEKSSFEKIEIHMKAQHRDMPFYVRRQKSGNLYLEVYAYKCSHCEHKSASLVEATTHWMNHHVNLDLRFSLELSSSTIIKDGSVTASRVPLEPEPCPNSTGASASNFTPTTAVSFASPASASSTNVPSASDLVLGTFPTASGTQTTPAEQPPSGSNIQSCLSSQNPPVTSAQDELDKHVNRVHTV